MSNNLPNLFEVLPRINATISVLSPQDMTKDGRLFAMIFRNAEELLNTEFWPKFIEKKLMKSQLAYLFKHFNLQYIPKLGNVLPSPLPMKRSGRSRK